MLAFLNAYLTNRNHERRANPVANGISAKQKRCPTSKGGKYGRKYF